MVGSFLGLTPTIEVITNVEHDHPDCYPTFDDMLAAFREFIDRLPSDGMLVACGEDALWVRELQLAGRRRMPAAAFATGRSLRSGTRLGA